MDSPRIPDIGIIKNRARIGGITMLKARIVTTFMVLTTVVAVSTSGCSTTIDRTSVSTGEASYLDAVADLGGFDADKLDTGGVLCQLWADLLASGDGLPTASGLERSAVERKGASGPNADTYAEAANAFLCPGRRDQARALYLQKDNSGFYDPGGDDPNPDPPGGEYQFGD